MNILKKYKNRILIIIFLIFTFYAIANIIQSQNEPEEVEEEIKEIPKKETPKKEDKVIIDIKGEIVNPGVYELKSTNTVIDQTTPNMIQRIIGIFERKPLISKEI